MNTKKQAEKAAKLCKARLDKHTGFNWEITLGENFGWNWSVLLGNVVMITNGYNIRSLPDYWGMIGRNGSGNTSYHLENMKSFSTPEKCFDYLKKLGIENANKEIQYHQDTLAAINEGKTAK